MRHCPQSPATCSGMSQESWDALHKAALHQYAPNERLYDTLTNNRLRHQCTEDYAPEAVSRQFSRAVRFASDMVRRIMTEEGASHPKLHRQFESRKTYSCERCSRGLLLNVSSTFPLTLQSLHDPCVVPKKFFQSELLMRETQDHAGSGCDGRHPGPAEQEMCETSCSGSLGVTFVNCLKL